MPKKIGNKEQEKIKATYNAASAFTSIMSSMLQREQVFMDYNKMKKHIIDELEKTTDEHATGNGDENSKECDEDVDKDESPKP